MRSASIFVFFIWILCQSTLVMAELCNQKLILIKHEKNDQKNSTSNLNLKDIKQRDYITNQCWNELKQLTISNSALSELEENLFPVNVQSIDLSNNKISDINQYAFDNLQQLVDLDLSDNYIRKLHLYTFCTLDNLQELILKNNQITGINMHFCGKPIQFHTLDLHGNNLNQFYDQNIKKWDGKSTKNQVKKYELFSLKKLDLSSNPHLKLEYGSFSNSNEMTRLYLHDISAISSKDHLLSRLINLEELSIDHNRLQYFDCSYLPKLDKLKTLLINGRNITQVFCSKSHLSSLSKINITKNSIDFHNFKKLKKELEIIGITLHEHGRIETSPTSNSNEDSMFVLIVGVLIAIVVILLICVLILVYYLLRKTSSQKIPNKIETNSTQHMDNDTSEIPAASIQRFVKELPLEQVPINGSPKTKNDGNVIYSTIVHENTAHNTAQSDSNLIYGFIGNRTGNQTESHIQAPRKQGKNSSFQAQMKTDDSVTYAQIKFQ